MSRSEYEKQLPDYLDGALSSDALAAFERRLEVDPELARQVHSLTRWREALETEGARIRKSGEPAPGSLDRVWERCACDLRSERAWSALEATILIKSLMRPICGLGTVEMTLAYARDRADGNFRDLLSHWSAAVASICGSTTGELVLSAGMRMVGETGG